MLELNRKKLQENLYNVGAFAIENYGSFEIDISEEDWEADISGSRYFYNAEKRIVKGIYKYYFVIDKDKMRTPAVMNYGYSGSAGGWYPKDNLYDWYRLVYSIEDYNELIGLNWGAETFLEWHNSKK